MPDAPPPTSTVIRPAVSSDLDALVDVLWAVAAEGRWLGAEVPFDREERRRRFADMLSSAAAELLVADAQSADTADIVGFISVQVAGYGVADIGMAILESWRGRGTGRALLASAIEWAARAGAHKVALEVWPDNGPAIGLYRSAGFVEEGRKVAHYRRRDGQLWDSLLMGRPLRPDGRR
ncbi:GNAT family N-acetyltransferase [Acidiferrimicrobium sp. IK]|uniref:GNAT family N-acetyltransferase n=1 Tax=Acidiferrimicrobium sp. IK TaxID=2871700 RepID=UPI0021CB7D92|nr:N-acetyltransferase [Acidiferrimicrobium sp. IK]MCU4184632.1 GNAT family N-acetyltransferase [Acidiferrimicrobium sp. IK]